MIRCCQELKSISGTPDGPCSVSKQVILAFWFSVTMSSINKDSTNKGVEIFGEKRLNPQTPHRLFSCYYSQNTL